MKSGVDHIGICVVFFCHDGKGNVLMAKRNHNARDEHNVWDIGAGAIEMGETAETTLRKEIKEEYNTDVESYEFLGYRDVFRTHEGQKTHWISLDFKVLVNPNQVKNNEPHKFDEIKWFKVEEMPKQVHSEIPRFLKLYGRQVGLHK